MMIQIYIEIVFYSGSELLRGGYFTHTATMGNIVVTLQKEGPHQHQFRDTMVQNFSAKTLVIYNNLRIQISLIMNK